MSPLAPVLKYQVIPRPSNPARGNPEGKRYATPPPPTSRGISSVKSTITRDRWSCFTVTACDRHAALRRIGQIELQDVFFHSSLRGKIWHVRNRSVEIISGPYVGFRWLDLTLQRRLRRYRFPQNRSAGEPPPDGGSASLRPSTNGFCGEKCKVRPETTHLIRGSDSIRDRSAKRRVSDPLHLRRASTVWC